MFAPSLRRAAGAFFVAGSLGIVASTALGGSIPSKFTIVDLGRLPGSYATWPEGINNNGEVVGFTHGPFTQYRAFKWTVATGLVELPPPAGFTDSRATDISENGIICGVAQNGLEGAPRSWRLIDGVYELLPNSTPNGCTALFANGVNDDGTVVGTIVGTAAGCPNTYAFYFSDSTGLISIPALSARDINNSGVATGRGFPEAYRYTPETGVVPIGRLPGDDQSEGRAINENSDVAGRSIDLLTGPDPWRAFFVTGGGPPINISPTLFSRRSAEGLNNLNHAVGSDGTSNSPQQYPWIWSPQSGRVRLTDLVNLPPDYFALEDPVGINDSDRIIISAIHNEAPDYYAAGLLLVPAVRGGSRFGDTMMSDVVGVIAAWGPCAQPGIDCPGDRDGDKDVDVDDVVAVMADWE